MKLLMFHMSFRESNRPLISGADVLIPRSVRRGESFIQSISLIKARISNYEQGIRHLGMDEAQILAQALGTVSALYLLYLDDEGFLSDQEQELVRCFRRTDKRGRETIVGVTKSPCDVPPR